MQRRWSCDKTRGERIVFEVGEFHQVLSEIASPRKASSRARKPLWALRRCAAAP